MAKTSRYFLESKILLTEAEMAKRIKPKTTMRRITTGRTKVVSEEMATMISF